MRALDNLISTSSLLFPSRHPSPLLYLILPSALLLLPISAAALLVFVVRIYCLNTFQDLGEKCFDRGA